jgi:hypothetical protein
MRGARYIGNGQSGYVVGFVWSVLYGRSVCSVNITFCYVDVWSIQSSIGST